MTRRRGDADVRRRVHPVFDLDGTLLDSDRALVDAFVALGVARQDITFGHVLAEECERLGIQVDEYLEVYDTAAVAPFAGVGEMLGRLERWSVCSNKRRGIATAELDRLGWTPTVALFAEDFGGPKRLEPVLEALGIDASSSFFVGDTAHDRVCASQAGVRYGVAAWNPRAEIDDDDLVLARPADVLSALA